MNTLSMTKSKNLNDRVKDLISKYSNEGEEGRRFLRLAAKLIRTSDRELADYILKHKNETAGIAQSILYQRGKNITEFDRPYGGSFLEFRRHDKPKKLVFSVKNAGCFSKYPGYHAMLYVTFSGENEEHNITIDNTEQTRKDRIALRIFLRHGYL